jgi:hypothetical protein
MDMFFHTFGNELRRKNSHPFHPLGRLILLVKQVSDNCERKQEMFLELQIGWPCSSPTKRIGKSESSAGTLTTLYG